MKMPSHQSAHQRGITKSISLVICAVAFAALCPPASVAQEGRYTNDQYGVSFQPPPGWVKDDEAGGDVLVQYLGPQRADRTRPVLNLTAQNSLMGFTDDEINAVASELTADFDERGMQEAKVTDRRRMSVGGFDALQLGLTYRRGNDPTEARQVYLPITEHGRTYLFTFIDTARHFGESSVAATNAINSFTAAVSRRGGPAAATPGARSAGGAGQYTLLLVIAGFVALVVIIGAVYLLLQRRKLAR
jgi:hypothetical protein